MKTKQARRTVPQLRVVWADYDPAAPRGDKWALYTTPADQRSNRPDLQPIRLRVSPYVNGGAA